MEGLAGKFVHRIASYNEHTCALVKPSGSNTRSDLDSAFVADMSSMVNNKDSFSDVCFIVQGEKVDLFAVWDMDCVKLIVFLVGVRT